MRGSLGLPFLVFVLTSVACGGTPLRTLDKSTGTAGTHPTGAAGQGGSTAGVGGATLTGIAGASGGGPGAAGTVGAAGAAGITGAGGATGGSTGTPGATNKDGSCVTGAFNMPPNTGPCVCQDSQPDLCPTVGCVDKRVDPANCGVCGTACGATSTCNAGACGPAPMVVLPAFAGCTAMTIAVNGGNVFYTDATHGTVNKIGGATPIATGEPGATWLATVGANLFWYDKGTKKIRMIPAAGGAAADVYANTATAGDAAAPPEIAGFLVSPDGATLYVSLGTQVLEAPVAGGASSVVANETWGGLPAALALNGTTNIVYTVMLDGFVDAPLLAAMPSTCGMHDSNGNVDMTTCPRLAEGQGGLLSAFIAVVAGHAYWIDGEDVRGRSIDPMAASSDGIATAQDQIMAAAATTDTIYFADGQAGDGFIEKTPLAPGSTATVLARGQNTPIAIAVDAKKVYWATSDCAVMSLDR
jgi:hypothetical protein